MGILSRLFRKQVRKALEPQKKSSSASNSKQAKLDRGLDFLRERWENVFLPDGSIADGYPTWYGDPVTDAQLNKLQELGIEVSGTTNKGQASNIIGLFYPVEEKNKEILRFLKIEIKGHNQTTARYVAQEELWSNEENLTRWHVRPLKGIRRDFFQFMNIPAPTNVTVQQLDEIENNLTEKQLESKEYLEYEMYVDTYDDITSSDEWKDYLKRKPNLKLYKEIWATLRDEGTDMQDVSAYEIFDAIVDKYPELEAEN